jgi:hypothetical protein
MYRSLISLGVVCLTLSTGGQAQAGATQLSPGIRIRIHSQHSAPLVGNLVSLGADSLLVALSPADTARVALESIMQVEISQGSRSNAGKGAKTGLLIGGLGGAVLGAIAAASQNENDFLYVPPAQLVVGGALGWGVLGAGIGALIGSGSHSEKWTPTVLPTVKVMPDESKGRRVALGLRISF